MTPQQAGEWAEYHAGLFPTWLAWLTAPGLADQRAAAIERAMAAVRLEDAKAASDRMFAGQVKRAWNPEDAVGLIVAACPRQGKPRPVEPLPEPGPFRAMPQQMTATEREAIRQFVTEARARCREAWAAKQEMARA